MQIGQLIVFKGMLIGIYKSSDLFNKKHFGLIFSKNFTQQSQIQQEIENKDFMVKFEAGFRAVTNRDFDQFRAKRRWRPLERGEERYKAEMTINDESVTRSIVERRDGSTEIEVPRQYKDGVPHSPQLHVARDCGSVGRPAMMFARYGLGMRMTDSDDFFHRVQNIVLDATSESGMTVLRLDGIKICRVRYGPFKGQSTFIMIIQSTKEMKLIWIKKMPLQKAVIYFFILIVTFILTLTLIF